MAKYLVLFTYTGAIEGGGPERFAKSQKIIAEDGGEILAVYGLLGPYDIAAFLDAPGNRAAMKISARVSNLIGARSVTMPAVEQDDFLQLLTEL